jgi:hypothetical protein
MRILKCFRCCLTKLVHSKLVLSDLNLQFEEVDASVPFELKKNLNKF